MGETDGRDDALHAVTRRLVSDEHDAIVGAMSAAVFDEHPGYEAMRDKEGFRAGVSRLVHLLCATVAERRSLTAEERSFLHVTGAQRQRQGLQRREIVGGLKTAVDVAWDVVTRLLADECASTHELQAQSTVLFGQMGTFADDAVEALLAGYQAEAEQPLPSRVRVEATVLDRLLEPGWENEQHYEFARNQGVRVLPPLAVVAVVASLDTNGVVLRDAAKAIVDRVPNVLEGATRTTGAQHVVLALNQAEEPRIEQLRQVAVSVAERLGVVIVVSQPVEELVLVARAYDSLCAHLAFAPVARRKGGLVSMDQLRQYALWSVLPPDDRTDFALTTLDGVLKKGDAKKAVLLDTFDAWLRAGGDAKAAGVRLGGVSPASVRYRLRRLHELTGKRFGDVNDLHVLISAYRIYRGWIVPIAHKAT